MWLILLSLATNAHALTTNRSGYGIELAGGATLALPPVSGGGSASVGAHWWFGPYDDSYAIGRYWAIGTTDRVDFGPAGLSLAPMLELRRGTDLIVLGMWSGLAGGPLIALGDDTVIGATGRFIAGAEFRRSRFWGFTGRIELGADMLGDTVVGVGSLQLGLQFSRPADGAPVD
jgi:hypothetical protein